MITESSRIGQAVEKDSESIHRSDVAMVAWEADVSIGKKGAGKSEDITMSKAEQVPHSTLPMLGNNPIKTGGWGCSPAEGQGCDMRILVLSAEPRNMDEKDCAQSLISSPITRKHSHKCNK